MAVPTLSLASFYRRTGTLRPRHEGRETRTGHRGNKLKRKAPKVCLFADLYLKGGGEGSVTQSPNNQQKSLRAYGYSYICIVSVQNTFWRSGDGTIS